MAEPELSQTRPGSHSFVVSGTKFEVDCKYKPIKPIGHGAYGVVMYVAGRVIRCVSLMYSLVRRKTRKRVKKLRSRRSLVPLMMSSMPSAS